MHSFSEHVFHLCPVISSLLVCLSARAPLSLSEFLVLYCVASPDVGLFDGLPVSCFGYDFLCGPVQRFSPAPASLPSSAAQVTNTSEA